MDTYENTTCQQDVPAEQIPAAQPACVPVSQAQPVAPEAPQPAPQPAQPQPVWQPVQSRRESPYANSPYICQQPVYYQQPPKAPKQPKAAGKKGWKVVLCAVLALVILAGACVATAIVVNSNWQTRLQNMQAQYDQKLDDLQSKITDSGSTVIISGEPSPSGYYTPAQVYAMSVDGVVIINAKISYTEYGKTNVGVSTGSGFIISEDGYVVTNYHVVNGGTAITVGTNDGKEHPAKLIGYDSTNDVALLKIMATGLNALPLGDSDAMIVGDQVAAVGNPLGELTSTLTVGYISAKERDVNTDGFAINMLQTDAAINSGNSGGPLLNMRGEVVGITTAKYSGTSSSGATIEGVGFAIPINDVSDLISDLMTYGYVNSAYLGVSVSDVDPDAAAYFGSPRGAYVEEVVEGFCAKNAGVRVKDIIVALGEYKIETVNDLTRVLRKFAPGETTTITVYRSGTEHVLQIVLDEKPKTTEEQPQQAEPTEPSEETQQGWYDYLKPYFDESMGKSYDEWFEEFMKRFGY